jgi:Xaa-Pro aminopeptidase
MSAEILPGRAGGAERSSTVKIAAEVELLHAAACVGVRATRMALATAAKGVSVGELERVARRAATEAGADDVLEVSVDAGGSLGGAESPVDRERRLESGDLVSVAIAGSVASYCFRRSEVGVVGAATGEQQAFLDHLSEACRWMIVALRPSEEMEFVTAQSRGREILPAARGIGRELREEPVIESNRRFTVEPGTVLVVEPVVSSSQYGNAVISQTIVVTETGAEALVN